MGNWNSELALFRAVVVCSLFAGNPAFAWTLTDYGNQCLKYHDAQKAQSYFKSAIAANNRDAAAHFGLSQALYLQGQLADTAKELALVISLDKNGSLADRARMALSRLNNLSHGNGSNSAAQKQSATPSDLLSYRIQLGNGQFFSPYTSPHLTEGWILQLKRIETDRGQRLQNTKTNWEKYRQQHLTNRDSLEPGSLEYRHEQARLDEIPKGIIVDTLEIDEDFMKKCREINAIVDNDYKRSAVTRDRRTGDVQVSTSRGASGHSAGSRDPLTSEIEQRLKQLQAEADAEVAAVQAAGKGDKDRLELSRANALASSSAAPLSSEAWQIQSDFNTKWDQVDMRVRAEVFEIRQKYAGLMAEIQKSTTSLKTQHDMNRDDDAKFMPIGKTNSYARAYQTFGEPTGNPIPYIAEPKRLSLDAPKPATKAP